jgi:hypothetical protein
MDKERTSTKTSAKLAAVFLREDLSDEVLGDLRKILYHLRTKSHLKAKLTTGIGNAIPATLAIRKQKSLPSKNCYGFSYSKSVVKPSKKKHTFY